MILSGITISGGGLSLTPAGGAAGPIYPGTSYGYTGTPAITRYSYASDGNAVSVGTLQSPGMNRSSNPGIASETNGYVAGSTAIATPGDKRNIQKYSYASATTNAAVSALLVTPGKYDTAGSSSKAQGYGYVIAGDTGDPSNTIEKFSFSADTNSTLTGGITVGTTGYMAGLSSPANGYTAQYVDPRFTPAGNSIRKFSFASDGNAVTTATSASQWQFYQMSCSTEHGYMSGGNDGSTLVERFSFASDTTVVSFGNTLYATGSRASGSSSTTHGYQLPGRIPAGFSNWLTKFPYATGSGASSVGTLASSSEGWASTQV